MERSLDDPLPLNNSPSHFETQLADVDSVGLSLVGQSQLLGNSTPKEVVKRPFLKKGSRMPISQIPPDPFTPVVKAVKNPPPSRIRETAGLDPHDLDRVSMIMDSHSPAGRTHEVQEVPQKAAPRLRSVPPMVAESSHHDAHEDLESFLRDMSNSVHSVADHVRHLSKPGISARSDRAPSRNTSQFEPAEAAPPRAVSSRRGARASPDNISEWLPSRRPRPRLPSAVEEPSDIELEMKKKLQELDDQILKFKKENDYCKKLRLEREKALAEAQRIRERALTELEAAEKDIYEQRNLISAERKRLQQDKERGRTLLSQLREVSDENKELKSRLADTESTLGDKITKLKAEVVRLTATVSDLMQAKHELAVVATPSAVLNNKPEPTSEVASSYTHPDGRVDKVYTDGRREAVFASGLQKTVWPDGSALVKFPNGDVKETSYTGVVVYTYAATGCVQTTDPDGLETLEFPSGQVERHFPDGTKEIKFPNGVFKRIDGSGRELAMDVALN